MVTVVKEQNSWADIGENLASGFTQGYQNRADEKAIKKSVEDLPTDASPRQILDAITGTRTYNPQAKKTAADNYLKSHELSFKERELSSREKVEGEKIAAGKEKEIARAQGRANTEAERNKVKREDIAAKNQRESSNLSSKKADRESKEKLKALDIAGKQTKADEKTKAEEREVKALYKHAHPKASDEEVAGATKDLKPADLRAMITKPENVTEYDIAKNHAKRLEPIAEDYLERGRVAKDVKSATEQALIQNEKYDDASKWWDAAANFLLPGGLADLIRTRTGQELATYGPLSIAKFADRMKGVLSVKKLNILESKAFSPTKDKDTRRLLLYMDLYAEKMDVLRSQFTDEILANDKFGLPPKNFNKLIDEKMKPYEKMVDADFDLLNAGRTPKSPLARNDIIEQRRAGAKPGQVYVYDDKGKDAYIPEEKLGTPGYERFKKYE